MDLNIENPNYRSIRITSYYISGRPDNKWNNPVFISRGSQIVERSVNLNESEKRINIQTTDVLLPDLNMFAIQIAPLFE